MTARLHVLRAGASTTVQDLGRYGAQALGVPVSGALDPVSLRLGNALVNNPQDAAGLEIRLFGPRFRVEGSPIRVALAGTTAPLEITAPDPRSVPAWQSVTLEPGAVFGIGAMADTSTCVLAIAGGFALAPVLGSLSTYAPARLGGFEGRALRDGDQLDLVTPAAAGLERRFRKPPSGLARRAFRVVLGPQDDRFTASAMATLLGRSFAVSHASNRMGLRLEGPPLGHSQGHDLASDGIVAGAIQVPGNGQPIVLLADHQTTGGYPKIATVISADLPALGRLRPGDEIRFAPVEVSEAEAVRRAQEAWLAKTIAQIEAVPKTHDAVAHALFEANLVSGVVRGDEDH